MAFDAGMTAAAVFEINSVLPGAHIEKIFQPERSQIDIVLRSPGSQFVLSCSATPGTPRVALTSIRRENPTVPPTFCTFLRKHLASAKFIEARQVGFDRVTELSFLSRNEMGDESVKYLYCETMGKYGNIVLCSDTKKIIGVLKPIDFSDSQIRQLLPGLAYVDSPTQNRKNPLTETKEGFLGTLAGFDIKRAAEAFIISTYIGFSPLVAREIVFRASGHIDSLCADIIPSLLWQEFSRICDTVREGKFTPTIVFDGEKPSEYSFTELKQYGSASTKTFDTVSMLFDTYYGERERIDHIRSRSTDIKKLLTNAQSRIRKKIAIQENELADCAGKEEYKRKGDLISSNLWQIEKGAASAKLTDYNSETLEEVTVELDRRLSPSANAQKWYKKYAKARTAQVVLSEQVRLARAELEYLETVSESLDRAETQDDLDEIRRELYESGFASRMKNYHPKKASPSKPMHFVTHSGYDVYCGRNNTQNEYVTFRLASKQDWWFHVKGAPGSHTVMITGGEEPAAQDFTEAAMIAAVYSKLAGGVSVPVDYTKIKNVKKPPASRPGFVTFSTNYSCYVKPDAKAVALLRAKNV